MEKGHRYGRNGCVCSALLSLEDARRDSTGRLQSGSERNRTLEFCFTDQRDFSLCNAVRMFYHFSVVYSHLFRVPHAVQIRHTRLSANEIGRANGIERTSVLRVVKCEFAKDKLTSV